MKFPAWIIRYDVPSLNGHVYRRGSVTVSTQVPVFRTEDQWDGVLGDIVGLADVRSVDEGLIVDRIVLTNHPEAEALLNERNAYAISSVEEDGFEGPKYGEGCVVTRATLLKIGLTEGAVSWAELPVLENV